MADLITLSVGEIRRLRFLQIKGISYDISYCVRVTSISNSIIYFSFMEL